MQFLELEKGMQGRLFGDMQALSEIRREGEKERRRNRNDDYEHGGDWMVPCYIVT